MKAVIGNLFWIWLMFKEIARILLQYLKLNKCLVTVSSCENIDFPCFLILAYPNLSDE